MEISKSKTELNTNTNTNTNTIADSGDNVVDDVYIKVVSVVVAEGNPEGQNTYASAEYASHMLPGTLLIDDLGLDSLGIVEVISALEDVFHIPQIDEDEVLRNPTVGGLADIVRERLVAQGVKTEEAGQL